MIDAGEMHRRWKDNSSEQCIPGVEAGYRGPVPLGSIVNALLIDRDDLSLFGSCHRVDDGLLRSLESYCQKLCMGLSCGGAILAFSIHEFDASNDLGELI